MQGNTLITVLNDKVMPALSVDAVYGGAGWTSQKGRQWRAACPLHGGNNKTAFSVNTKTLRWHCSTRCGGGDAVDYVTRKGHARDFLEAVRFLADLAGVDFPGLDLSPEAVAEVEARRKEKGALEGFLEATQEALEGSPAQEYLKSRGITLEQAERYGLGYFARDLEVNDLAYVVGDLKERLTAPWYDRAGRIINIWGRSLDKRTLAVQKYKNMTGGIPSLAPWLIDQIKGDHVLIVEGYLDAIALRENGFEAVATGGANLSKDQVTALERAGVKTVTLVFDNDVAGREGLERAVLPLNRSSLRPFVINPANLSPAKDPDELIRKKGARAFKSLYEGRQALEVYTALLLLEGVKRDSPEADKLAAINGLADYLEDLPGPLGGIFQEHIIEGVSHATGHHIDTIEPVIADAVKRSREKHIKERQTATIREALEALEGSTADPLEVARDFKHNIDQLVAVALDTPPPFSVLRLEEESGQLPTGYGPGWESLRDLEISFNPGELIIAAGRTGHGKTTFLVNLLNNFCNLPESPGPFLFYSLEEPEIRIYHRLLSLLTAEPEIRNNHGGAWTVNQIRDYKRNPESRAAWSSPESLWTARDKLEQREGAFQIIYRPAWTVEEIATHARVAAEQTPIGGVLVDYLQRTQPPPGKYDRRDIEISAIGRRFKSLALDLNAPVIVAAQIDREAVPANYREKLNACHTFVAALDVIETSRPDLHHLREGGSEQEADLILGLLNYAADYRSDDDPTPDETPFEVGTLKNRAGTPGRWGELIFEGRFNLLRDESDWVTGDLFEDE